MAASNSDPSDTCPGDHGSAWIWSALYSNSDQSSSLSGSRRHGASAKHRRESSLYPMHELYHTPTCWPCLVSMVKDVSDRVSPSTDGRPGHIRHSSRPD